MGQFLADRAVSVVKACAPLTAGGEPSQPLPILYSTGTNSATTAGRISFFFGLSGPCYVLNTACSSSLVSVHVASESLRSKESDIAVAAGINIFGSGELQENFKTIGFLSKRGTSAVFDTSADGYVRSEGCGVLVLKRYVDAMRDGDTVYGILESTNVNQDGFSSTLTAPNPQAQEKLMTDALRLAGRTREEIGYLEAHGTGTQLGDRIELSSINEVYAKGRKEVMMRIYCIKAHIATRMMTIVLVWLIFRM